MRSKVMARPGRFELPTLCLEAVRSTLPNLARGVANRADSPSWVKSPHPAFSFLHCCLPPFCRRFPHFALHFRDSRLSRPPELLCKLLSALNCMMAVVRFFGRWFLPNLPHLRTWVRSPPRFTAARHSCRTCCPVTTDNLDRTIPRPRLPCRCIAKCAQAIHPFPASRRKRSSAHQGEERL